MLNTPFSPWPSYTEEEAAAVRDVLSSNKTNYRIGGVGRAFEREYAKFCGANHAVAVANRSVIRSRVRASRTSTSPLSASSA